MFDENEEVVVLEVISSGEEIKRRESNKAAQMADAFFKEYHMLCMNPAFSFAEHIRFQSQDFSKIIQLPIEEQAKYADYVTKKMCEQSKEIICEFLTVSPLEEIETDEIDNPTSLGNFALLLISLPDGEEKTKSIELFHAIIQKVKETQFCNCGN